MVLVVSGGEHVDEVIGAAVADGKVTPKVQSLIKLLLKYQHTADFRAIVFVERVVAALVLPKVRIKVKKTIYFLVYNFSAYVSLSLEIFRFLRSCLRLVLYGVPA